MQESTYLKRSRYPLFRLLSYMKGERRTYLLACLYSVLNKLFDIFPEVLIGAAVDVVVNQKSSWLSHIMGNPSMTVQLATLGIATFVAWLLESIFQYLFSVKWRNLAQTVEHKLRMETYSHIQNAPMQTIDDSSVGQLIATINDDINQLERFLEDGINQIIQIVASSIMVGCIFMYFSPLIALFAVCPIPFILVGAFYFQHKLEPKFLMVRAKAANISQALANNLSGLMTIKSYTAEGFEQQRIRRLSDDYQNANRETIKISAMVTPVIRIIILTGFLFTLMIGGYKTINHTMNVGVFSLLVFLSQRLLWPFSRLAEVTVDYQRSMASTTRILNLLTWPQETSHIVLPSHATPTREVSGLIIHDLSFQYPRTKHPLFSHFHCHIPLQQTIAFVGESGSGKSTLIKLLCRFYQAQQGGIYWQGRDIQSMDLTLWRNSIAVVNQDIFIFEGTIADNIAYARVNTNREAIVAAAKIAGADSFIEQLPGQYDAQVGERGNRLSGGQRQRIAIARAVLKDAPILVLDEATSAVDNETELAIQKALHTISHHKTTIIIAHRLSTITHADQIYVLDNGEIVEEGNHNTLLAHKGGYHRLWQIQTGEAVDMTR
jgi:ATP-binding cassette, subfamily B, bacterial